MRLPTPTGKSLLIEPYYDPDKIGSIWMPPEAQNDAPSQGVVVAVGGRQTEVEVGFRVLVSYVRWVKKESIYNLVGDTRFYFYDDDEVIAFLTDEGDVFPRSSSVIIRPSWNPSGVVKKSTLYSIDRVFQAPSSPATGTILRVGESVTTLKAGDTVVIPKSGGFELGVRDRVLYSIEEKHIMGILTNAVETDRHRSNRPRRETARGPR